MILARDLQPDGVVVLSTWAAESPLGLFGPIVETLQELGVAEPFPRAFDPDSFRMGAAELTDLLEAAGWRGVQVRITELVARWDSTEAAASTLLGTPYGPVVSALPGDDQDQVRNRLITKLAPDHQTGRLHRACRVRHGAGRMQHRPWHQVTPTRPADGLRPGWPGRRRGRRGLRRW